MHKIMVTVAEVPTALSELGLYELIRISAFRITEQSIFTLTGSETVISDAQREACALTRTHTHRCVLLKKWHSWNNLDNY
jgi:hypothetical protein